MQKYKWDNAEMSFWRMEEARWRQVQLAEVEMYKASEADVEIARATGE